MGRHTDTTGRTNPLNTDDYRPRHAAQETTPRTDHANDASPADIYPGGRATAGPADR